MKIAAWKCGLLLLSFAAGEAIAAPATQERLSYAAPDTWVAAPPAPTDGAPPAAAPFRVIYRDQQVRIGDTGQEAYSAYRVRILRPEGLPIGNVSISWSPSAGSATVHHLRIIRGDEEIDILRDHRFQVIQREGGMERSVLDGELTAMLQAPGLRVGDELEFAATIVNRDPTLGDHAFGSYQFPMLGSPGVFRYQMSWPDSVPLMWRATRDLPQAVRERKAADEHLL